MIVKIIEIRLKDTRNSNSFPTRTTNRRDDLAHRKHDPTKLHQLLAQPVNTKLHLLGIDGVVEELVLYVFNHVVEMLNGIEMAVNKDIEAVRTTGRVGSTFRGPAGSTVADPGGGQDAARAG